MLRAHLEDLLQRDLGEVVVEQHHLLVMTAPEAGGVMTLESSYQRLADDGPMPVSPTAASLPAHILLLPPPNRCVIVSHVVSRPFDAKARAYHHSCCKAPPYLAAGRQRRVARVHLPQQLGHEARVAPAAQQHTRRLAVTVHVLLWLGWCAWC